MLRYCQYVFQLTLLLGCYLNAQANEFEVTKKSVINVGYHHLPPFILDNDTLPPSGLFITLFDRMFSMSALQPRYVRMPPGRMKRLTALGTDTQIVFAQKHKLYNDRVLYSEKPAWIMQCNIYWQKDVIPVKSLEQLRGKKLVLVRGFHYGGLRKIIIGLDLKFYDAPDSRAAIKMLMTGRGDYTINYGKIFHANTTKEERLNFEKQFLQENYLYITVHKSIENAQEVLDRLYTSLNKMYTNGEIERLTQSELSNYK